ncbi:P-loop containing nucleoside triphosphate hydrolase protein [Armillaria luteobubalina]|uniref:P-loop containing nucleoside triphosphate hydrolase protein n=1 Tax=Armillaria luteobubalina TaxID=153913 RepID=A0AA39PHH3_9AGAR|nr:P-loop containing nucleoside triphosphate hydrolase protein [Armillaria luteobubalina]
MYVTADFLHAIYFAPFVVSFAARACYLLAELSQKRQFLWETVKPMALETTSSLLSRLFFVYLFPVLLGGFKRAFDLDDLVAFVAAVILWFKASFAMIPPIVIMVGFFVITSHIGNHVAKAQKRWMGSTQNRLKVLTSVMSQIIPIKLLAVEPTMPKWMEPVRFKEIGYLKAFYARLVIVGLLSSATIHFAGIAALGRFVGLKSEDLYPETLFTILTVVVNLVTLLISTVGNCFSLLLASYASMKRIAGFLSLPEKTSFTEQDASTSSKFSDDEKNDIKHPSDISLSTYSPSWVTLLHATIAVGKDEKALLSDCNVSFGINSVSMIVGPVAAEKSILLKTLLGETYFIDGAKTSVLPQGRITYAPQEAFIWPATVRANIVLDNEFNPQWYETVVDACPLRPDLARMANGDMTEISPGSVSGGQKQRVTSVNVTFLCECGIHDTMQSLTRAIYAKCDVTLLDDCFSALESHTAVSVFARLLGEDGLLRGKGEIVVPVTHNLQHLASTDHIVILDLGAVIAEGSFPELHYQDLDVAQYIGAKKDEDEEMEVKEESKPSVDLTKEEEAKKPSQAAKKKVDEEEKNVRGSMSWATYRYYLKACGWDRLALCFTCLVIYTAMQIGLQILLKQ